MDGNNLKAQASVSEETIAKTLRDHKDNYNQWLRKAIEAARGEDLVETPSNANQSGDVIQT